MKIAIERGEFADRVGWVLRCVSPRATLPVLGGILVEASASGIRFAGTDLELAGEATGAAAVEEEGKVALPGRVIGEIARALPEGTVRLESGAGQARITCGAAVFNLRTLPVEDFPAFHVPGDAAEGTADGAGFAAAVAQVARAASSDEARPVLTGVLLEAGEGKATLVATDSYRLAVREIELEGTSEPLRRVVPARALQEAGRIADEGGPLRVALGESQVVFERPGRRLASRLIEGEFPNWRQLLPSDTPNILHVDRESFAEAVKRVGILAQAGAPVRLEFGPEGVSLAAGTQDLGEAGEKVEAKYEGEPITVAFNPQYLLDGIQAIDGPEVVLAARDGLKPAVLRGSGEDGFLYLVMPVRVS